MKNSVIYISRKFNGVFISINITQEKLSVIYPKLYEDNNSWKIKTNHNVNIEINNKKYSYLFYEYESHCNQEANEGFIVDDKSTCDFLKEK